MASVAVVYLQNEVGRCWDVLDSRLDRVWLVEWDGGDPLAAQWAGG